MALLDFLAVLAGSMLAFAGLFTIRRLVRSIRAKRDLAQRLRTEQVSEAELPGLLEDLRQLEESDPASALTAITAKRHANSLFGAIAALDRAEALAAMTALTQPSDRGRERYLRDLIGEAGPRDRVKAPAGRA